MKQEFNPDDWLQKPPDNSDLHSASSVFSPSSPHSLTSSDIFSEVDTVIARIEAAFTDITTSYNDWLSVGFAFAQEFGESGRSFFQRVSRFYPGFTLEACNKQFDHCLKSQGHGITIRTFFHMARQAGISLKGLYSEEQLASYQLPKASNQSFPSQLVNNPSSNPSFASECSVLPSPDSGLPIPEISLPTLPDYLFPTLPEFLKRVVERCISKEERDIILMGSLTTLSSCLFKVFGIYDDKRVFPNLYLYITAKASAGKGRLVLCKRLVQPIHGILREQSKSLNLQYESDLREFNLIKNKDLSAEKPKKPPEKLLFIPANSSSTGMFQLLSDNEGRGLIFETEGDTLAQAFKTDYGNYSDGFRKAFHNETITYYRRTDREYVEIAFPCVSTVLSGTPLQVATLIPNAENGLFSRFMFYYMNLTPVWKNVFLHGDRTLDDHFNDLGKEFYGLYKVLNEKDSLEFRLTPQQEELFQSFFTQIHEKYLMLQGIDYLATIRRLGLNAFRICMILSTLRLMETGDFSRPIYCRDDDLQSTLAIIRVLVRHASHIYSELPEEAKQIRPKNKQELFLENLPANFTCKEYLELAKTLSISTRTAERYMAMFCEKGLINRDHQGIYNNNNKSNNDAGATKRV